MRSLRAFSWMMEGLLIIVILGLFLGLLSTVTQQIVEQSTLSLEESMSNLDASISLYLNDRMDAFSQVSDSVKSNPADIVMPSFSDLYLTDRNYQVTRILQKAEYSLIFPGFDHSYSFIGQYLASHLDEGMIISPILQSPEFDYPSIYFVENMSDAYLFGRMSLEDLSGLLSVTARNHNGILLIASPEGYILSSTSVDLPFHVLPGHEVDEYAGYWITRHESAALGSELILLVPTDEVYRIAKAIQSFYPFYFLVIIIIVIGKLAILDVIVVRPIRHFVDSLSTWTISNSSERPSDLIMGTREFRRLYDQFEEKTDSISIAFKESEEARRKAIEAEESLKASEEELRAMNEELEDRIEKRSEELKLAYEQLVQQEKMASIGALVAGVSHEINTPIGICVTTTSFLQNQYKKFASKYEEGKITKKEFKQLQSDIDESLQILTSSLQRASELISSFKQVAVGQSVEEQAEFAVREQLDLLILSLRHEYKYKRHYFTLECPEELIVNSYAGVYMQIFTNLIMNAIIHGLSEKEEGEIKIEIADLGSDVEIKFSDDGTGIEPEELRRIYDPYFTTNREGGGSGLGLFIVYNLVTQKLGGTISCESELGKGTKFHIRIPKSTN